MYEKERERVGPGSRKIIKKERSWQLTVRQTFVEMCALEMGRICVCKLVVGLGQYSDLFLQ